MSLTKSFVVYFGGRSLNLYEVYQDVKNMARCLKMRCVNFISERETTKLGRNTYKLVG